MFDVFYLTNKPNLFLHEQHAESIEHARQLSKTRFFWIVNYLVDYTGFDFLWEPQIWEVNQRHAWPSQWQDDCGTYLVPKSGFTSTCYRKDFYLSTVPDKSLWTIPDSIAADEFDFSWHPNYSEPAYQYQFGTQWQKTGGPRYNIPGATAINYVRNIHAKKVGIDANWRLPENLIAEDFDFTWHPDSTEPPYIYQFGTQWQKTGGPQYVTAGASEVKYVDQIKVTAIKPTANVYLIDHYNKETLTVKTTIETCATVVKTVRYFDNYLDTLKRLIQHVPQDQEFIWICSSVCDYSNFDFTWHPEFWQAQMLHVFPSDDQKFGDTFFMHVPSFRMRIERTELLEWYDLNFCNDQTVSRLPMPVIQHSYDSHAQAIKEFDFSGPLAVFVNDHVSIPQVPVTNLWRNKTKTITSLSTRSSIVVVPKVACGEIKTQLYDWPYINKAHQRIKDESLDIVFVSNGESVAESNWEHLLKTVPPRHRIVRVDRVNGRVAAYQAAARASRTAWFFAIFAKLKVDENFNWDWQPDCMQNPKHYIFHAENPVNGLVYGHQAMIAYNKKLVMENSGQGLDFTLDQAHETVPILSGTALYADSAWMCWRTAFREVLKLLNSLPDIEGEYRLNQWLTVNNGGPHGDWSMIGARDAVEYYNSTTEFNDLKKAYEWSWLASYAFMKHNLRPDQ